MVLGFSIQANAALNLIGQGTSTYGTFNLIYDTDLCVTWYDFSATADTWQNQMDWASALSVTFGSNTYTDWRLPTTVDGIYAYGTDGTTTGGYNVTTSEMGHLFYTELGNAGAFDTSGNLSACGVGTTCLTNTGDFQNLYVSAVFSSYWSGTEYSANTSQAWGIGLPGLPQSNVAKIFSNGMALAVMDGMAVVPEPISSTLFIVGGATLGFRRFRKKFNK
jgi:hypothetical protein